MHYNSNQLKAIIALGMDHLTMGEIGMILKVYPRFPLIDGGVKS